MTVSIQPISATPDSNGAQAFDWPQSRIDLFGVNPVVDVTVNGRPHTDHNFSIDLPLTAPCSFTVYGLNSGDIIKLTFSKS